MQLHCTNCRQTLAVVDVKIPFSASVMCGDCGAHVGHQFIVEDKPALVAGSEEELSQAERELEAAIQRFDQLKAARAKAAAPAGS
jgi:hypothetical protein